MDNLKYLTPKKPLTEIIRERAEEAEQQNIDVYEAIAGLFEDMASLAAETAALTERVNKLEGGQAK